VRIATAVAGGLALAAAVMGVLAFTSGGDGGGQSAATATAGQTAGGKAVWLAQGCGSCHTLAAANAHGDIGPDLAATLKGAPASYVRESIVNPSAHAAAGYSTGAMPEDYASRMTPAELDRLVGFLRASAR
jgi:mono/diheme cytochrome c family protein